MSPKYSGKNGSAGIGKTRTYWDLTLTLAAPFSRWGAEPFITLPIPFSAAGRKNLKAALEPAIQAPAVHPFELARRWGEEITRDIKLTKAGIAEREGLSRARVTQIMNLLQLPDPILRTLENPPPPLCIGVFTERRLRELLAKDGIIAQLDFWQKWLRELGNTTQN